MELEIVTVSLISLGILIGMLSFGVPLPYCFGGALMSMVFLGGATMKGTMVWGFSQLANPVLLCIPLFVFAGTLMSESGIAASLLNFVNIFVGRIRGGLGVVAAVSCAIIGAISGSGLTGVAATGPILIPEMAAKGYPRGYATALVANSSILGLLIPPSVTMIIYGWVTDTSILACFLATLGPGLLITFLFCVVNIVMARKFPLELDPPKPMNELVKEGTKLTSKALPALVMPLIILGGIYGGVMTPTEAAAVAVIYAIPVGFLIYKGLTFQTFLEAAKNSATAVGAMTATAAASVGMIVNDVTAIILIAPLLLPLMQAIGVSPVQFAAIMGVNTAMGGVTPPYASILYLSMRIGKVEFSEVIKPAMLLIIFGYVPVVFLTSLWPDLSLFFPGLFGY